MEPVSLESISEEEIEQSHSELDNSNKVERRTES